MSRNKSAAAICGIAFSVILFASTAPESGSSRLVSVRQLNDENVAGQKCAWDDATSDLTASIQQSLLAEVQQKSGPSLLMAFLQQAQGQQLDVSPRSRPIEAANVITRSRDSRILADTYPTYTSVGVNLQSDEVVLQDNNLWSTRVFNRMDNTPPAEALTQPKRVIQGRNTLIQYNNGLYIDQNNGDIYSVESDTGDRMTVFARDANGNMTPKRELHTIHRAYAMTVDEERQELYITVEYPPKILIYRKDASGDEQPIRVIKGDHTLLQTPHGIALDLKNRLIFVDNWGQEVDFDGSDSMSGCCRNQTYETGVLGTGTFNAPSITVYPLDANGDTRPLQVIQGDRTQMNWPSNLSLDTDTEDLYVANDVNQSILVFTGMTHQSGNVAPVRVIKGDKTGLRNPTGVFVDTKHQELWVANLGNSSGTVYPLKADGNVAPLRTIRSAPRDHLSLTFGRTAAVAYDPNRQEILVPN
jgi:6-phosphogluconolactonase (cycloisomerase 2 family)